MKQTETMNKVCLRCKNAKNLSQFKSDAGRELVMCKRCRELQKARRGGYSICRNENCNTYPVFGKRGTNKKEYCKAHAPPNYVDVVHKQCLYENCETRPSFGEKGSSKKEYCKAHAPPSYVDVVDKQCLHENCETRPSFGKKGSGKKEYCKTHSLPGYVNVVSKHCLHENCETLPNYGEQGTSKKEYCKSHSPPGYVNVVDKHCLYENCETRPRYGKRGTNKTEYCKTHSPLGYVDVANKQCLHENCETQPSYGKKGTSKREYCKTHALSGYVDVSGKRCLHENCETRAGYGKPGYSPEYCAKHKTSKMLSNPLKYGKDDMKECTYCLAEIHYSDDFCYACKQFNILGQTIKTHTKELEIKAILEENFDSDIFNHDKTVTGGCSRKRPDFLLTADWGNIVLEVDEFQHKRKIYPCACEISRMKEIYFDCGVENLLFIRYNPDKYSTVSGGKPISKKKRQELLVRIINQYLETKEIENLGVLYLFYDGFSVDAIEIEDIEPYGSS